MTKFNQDISLTNATLLERWHLPHPNFSSGQDQRSSEHGLLELFYGGVEHASRYQWLNGGRTLIDKTYLSILWAAQELERPSIGFDILASNLDRFIRQHLAETWSDLAELDHEARHQFAIALVERAADELFASQHNAHYASQVLFFLCPQLPVFPYRDEQGQAIEALLPQTSINSYADYHQACRQMLALNLPGICSVPTPKATKSSIDALLTQTDWWPRRLLTQQLIAPAEVQPACDEM